jgi:hypothetical protein
MTAQPKFKIKVPQTLDQSAKLRKWLEQIAHKTSLTARNFVNNLTFKCLACQKDKRKRTFRAEHTVNPFNTNPDGKPKPASQVATEAQAAANLERDQFMTYPLCKGCEDARSWSEMKSIRARRRGAQPNGERA